MDNKKQLKSVSFKCKGCGSDLKFDPTSQNLKCLSCGNIQKLEKKSDFAKHDISEIKQGEHQKWKDTQKVLKCETCGAEIILHGLEFSGVCPYCNSSYVTQKDCLPDIVPDAVIPFCFDEVEAEKRFKNQLKRKFYVPMSCKKNVKPQNIKGVYIPAFSFDANIKAKYSGTLRTTNNENEVQYFNISGTHSKVCHDVLIENSSKITQKSLKKILPYNMEFSIKFLEGFVMGYVVEHYEDAFNDCLKAAQEEMKEKVKREILSQYSYDSVREFSMKCDFSNQKYQYNIVPIYQMNFSHKNKNYNVIMNGQTGKIGGKFPVSIFKVLLTIFGWILIIALIVYLTTIS